MSESLFPCRFCGTIPSKEKPYEVKGEALIVWPFDENDYTLRCGNCWQNVLPAVNEMSFYRWQARNELNNQFRGKQDNSNE